MQKRYDDYVEVTTDVRTKKRTKQRLRFMETLAPHPKTRTEFKRRANTISLSGALMSIRWLNASKGTASHKRVLAIRQELEELSAEFDALRQERHAAPFVDYAKHKTRFRERHNQFNKLLSRYNKFRPALTYDLDTGEWRYGLLSNDVRRDFQLVIRGDNSDVRVREADVVAALVRLAANRELSKVHLCTKCQDRWHLAMRKIDKFCSNECRAYFHQHSDEYRERKKKSQREYRERLKPLKQIGFA